MAVGSYAMGVLVVKSGVSFWLALVAGIGVAVAAGLLVGLPSLRLRADYFAISTLAFSEIVRYVADNWDGLTGGNLGLFGYADAWSEASARIDGWLEHLGIAPHFLLPLLLVNLALFLGLAAFVALLVRSPWGRVLKAIREDEDAARALGQEHVRLQAPVSLDRGGTRRDRRLHARDQHLDPLTGELRPGPDCVRLRDRDPRWAGELPRRGRRIVLPDLHARGDAVSRAAALRRARSRVALHDRRCRPDGTRGLPAPGDLRQARGADSSCPRAETPLLEVRSVTKRFAGVLAVDRATFDVAPRTITALIGPNGAGKSTLFNVLTGFERGDGGDVRFDAESVYGRAPHVIARRGMVRTFQLTKALAVMSVLDNMLLAAREPRRAARCSRRSGPSGAAPSELRARERVELLEVFGLAAKASDYAGTLSGGQRKLLELARALMLEPRMLLLDEPLAGVNRTSGRALLEHIERLRDERDVTILLVEHDMDVVMRYSDTVVVMGEGRVLTIGSPEDVRRDPRVIEAYLGTEDRRGRPHAWLRRATSSSSRASRRGYFAGRSDPERRRCDARTGRDGHDRRAERCREVHARSRRDRAPGTVGGVRSPPGRGRHREEATRDRRTRRRLRRPERQRLRNDERRGEPRARRARAALG